MKQKLIQFPFSIFITKEKKWFVAECPILGIATQGKTEKEVKDNMKELIQEYLSDPDTQKPQLREIVPSSLTYLSVLVPEKFLYGKT